MVRLLHELAGVKSKRQQSFNPTMVRLLRFCAILLRFYDFAFNPTMVRLLLLDLETDG